MQMIDETKEIKEIINLQDEQIQSDKKVIKFIGICILLLAFGFILVACSLPVSPCWHTDDTNNCALFLVSPQSVFRNAA